MGTAIKRPVCARPVKLSFVIFDIWALWRSAMSVRVPRCQKFEWQLNPVWHRMLYSCTHMATVDVKGIISMWVCVGDVCLNTDWSDADVDRWTPRLSVGSRDVEAGDRSRCTSAARHWWEVPSHLTGDHAGGAHVRLRRWRRYVCLARVVFIFTHIFLSVSQLKYHCVSYRCWQQTFRSAVSTCALIIVILYNLPFPEYTPWVKKETLYTCPYLC